FFGGACCWFPGGDGILSGTVLVAPVLGSVNVTDGWPGCAGPVPGVIRIGLVLGVIVTVPEAGPGCGGAPGCGAADCVFAGKWFSRIVLPSTDRRVAIIESVSDVIMNRIAEAVVAFDSSVADPRGPKAVWDPIPPNAPAKSAAFPLCNNTTTIKNRQISTCKIVKNVYAI